MMFFLSDEMPFSFEEWLLFGAAAGGKAIEDTATGNPLTFLTDLAKPLKSLLIPFTPQQEGMGDPSPQNIRSILPWNGLTVFGGGKNLLNPAKYLFNTNTSRGLTFEVQSDGSIKVTGTTESSDFGPALTERFRLPAGTYYGYHDGGDVYVTYRKATAESGGETTGLVSPFTLDGSEWVYCNIYVRNPGTFDTIIHPQIARENAQSSYEPYKPITETDISFPSPVYGGQHEAVSGKLNVPVAFAEFDGSDDESWNVGAIDANKSRAFIALAGAPKSGYNRDIIGNYIKPTASAQSSPDLWTANINASGNILIGIDPSITTVEGWKAYLAEHPLQIVYPLATPQEITLTPAQITALVGNNTIWSDADGQMAAVYLKKA